MATLKEDRRELLLQRWSHMGLKDLAIEFQKIQSMHAEEKAKAADTYAVFELLRKTHLPRLMEDMGITTAKIEGVGRIQVGQQVSAKQIDKQGLIEWLHQHNHDGLVAETINSSTLSSWMKQQIANGDPIPDPDIVDFTTYEVASVVKA